MRRGREEGFVLVATVWFVALLALAAVMITGWISRSIGRASTLQDLARARGEIISAENEIALRMVSGFFSVRGLELPQGNELAGALAPEAALGFEFGTATRYIALDDRPYRLGPAIVRLQDERGLYALNYPDPVLLGNLLRRYGVRYEDRAVLIDRLLDYLDKSELSRLNGATAADYARAGRPPPRGAPLLVPWEAMRVLSWDDYPALWRGPNALPDVTTIGDTAQINPNTAPATILETLPGMDQRAAERVINYRQRFLIENQLDLDRAAGVVVPIDPMSLLPFPSGSLRVSILSPDEPLVHRLALRLTPIGKAPYRVDYAVDLPVDDASRGLAASADLPQIPGREESGDTAQRP